MEKLYTEKQQGKIFSRALELQREAGGSQTLSQMQETALEAGIDPRYLAAAIEESERLPQVTESLTSNLQLVAICALVLAQVYTSSGQILGTQRDFYFPLTMALILGALSSGKQRLKGYIALAAVVGITTAITFSFFKLGGVVTSDEFAYEFRNTLLAQFVLFILGRGLFELWTWAHGLGGLQVHKPIRATAVQSNSSALKSRSQEEETEIRLHV